jgi:hypothetical protein
MTKNYFKKIWPCCGPVRRGMGHIFGSFELIAGEWPGDFFFEKKSLLYREIAYSASRLPWKSQVRLSFEFLKMPFAIVSMYRYTKYDTIFRSMRFGSVSSCYKIRKSRLRLEWKLYTVPKAFLISEDFQD